MSGNFQVRSQETLWSLNISFWKKEKKSNKFKHGLENCSDVMVITKVKNQFQVLKTMQHNKKC
jgi:hypothetical protein